MPKASWKLYKNELKNPTPLERRAERETDRLLISGYYRMRSAKTKVDWPVAIWTEAGKEEIASIFQIGRKIRNTFEHGAEWIDFIGTNWMDCDAVDEAEWHKAQETGFWADGKPAREMTIDEKLGIDMPSGGNNPPLAETLEDQIKTQSELADAKIAAGIKTQEDADAATLLLDKLRLLLQKAEKAREDEKEPYLEGGRQVDAKWKMIKAPGAKSGPLLKDARDKWLRAEQARVNELARQENLRRQEEARKAQEAELERQRQEREAANAVLAQQAEQMGMEPPEPAVEEEPFVLPVVVEEVVAPKVTAGSAFGRSVSATKVRKTIVDYAVFSAHLLASNDEDFLEYLQKRGERATRAKVTVPGVKLEVE